MPNVALPCWIPGATTEFVAPATRSHKIKNVSSFLFHAVEMAAPLRGLLDGSLPMLPLESKLRLLI